MIAVVPCFDEPDTCKALKSLADCFRPSLPAEVIFVVNYGEQVEEEAKLRCAKNYEEACDFARRFSRPDFVVSPRFVPDMPRKHAGVGLARKIGMDEAARRLHPKGLILCCDADAEYDRNYFIAIEKYFKENPRTEAGSIYFEHPVEGDEYPKEIYEGIIKYELHLRYYNQAQRWAGLPFAWHTVGSAMFCTAETYLKAGGMNRRKAGEDFYFLQKLIPHVHFAEINSTRVIPSPRISTRVPFGTGRAMLKYIDGEDILTYSLEAFVPLGELVKTVPELYRADKILQGKILRRFHPRFALYLKSINFYAAIDELNENCADYKSFEKRFFTWFNAFRTLKYLNEAHLDFFPKAPVAKEASKLLRIENINPKEILEQYRIKDRT
jgi:hypothetical protein